MTKFTTTDKAMVMKRAWRFFKTNPEKYDFATALKMAWEDVKAIKAEAVKVGEPVKTYVDWLAMGREVAHGVTAVFKLNLNDAKTKTGKRLTPFFGYRGTVAIGWNE